MMRAMFIESLEQFFHGIRARGVGTFQTAITELERASYDLIVIDPGLPGYHATDAAARSNAVRSIVHASPQSAHLVITGIDSQAEAEALADLRLAAYVSKIGLSRVRLTERWNALRQAHYHVQLANPDLYAIDIGLSGLTDRERLAVELMRERAPGETRRSIHQKMADQLNISVDSAAKYFKSGNRKLRRKDDPGSI